MLGQGSPAVRAIADSGLFHAPPSSDRASGSLSLTVPAPAATAAPYERLDPLRPYRTPGDSIVRPSEPRSPEEQTPYHRSAAPLPETLSQVESRLARSGYSALRRVR